MTMTRTQFFRKQGFKAEQARSLARGEEYAADHDWTFKWEHEESPDMSFCDAECEEHNGIGHDHEVLSCVLFDRNGNVLQSLGWIVDPSRSYARVVEAELAAEAMYHDETTAAIMAT